MITATLTRAGVFREVGGYEQQPRHSQDNATPLKKTPPPLQIRAGVFCEDGGHDEPCKAERRTGAKTLSRLPHTPEKNAAAISNHAQPLYSVETKATANPARRKMYSGHDTLTRQPHTPEKTPQDILKTTPQTPEKHAATTNQSRCLPYIRWQQQTRQSLRGPPESAASCGRESQR